MFLYHAYALALGGWVQDKEQHILPIHVAPSVLPFTGGYGSNSAENVNLGFPLKFPFGTQGPADFHIYIGRAYTEVSGVDVDDENPFGIYKTTARSILDDVRINDVFSVQHAEAILTSTHEKPSARNPNPEGRVVVGDSDMFGVRVSGKDVGLAKRDYVDREPTFTRMQQLMTPAPVGAGGGGGGWIDELLDWQDPAAVPPDAPDFDYARDIATMNQRTDRKVRYSIFQRLGDVPGLKTFRSSIYVPDFGRIFLGEVIASHGTKQVTMFRIDLGCDNCGGVGGSGGSTNGGPLP
ncbi:MAG TPA: hypothetical protein VJZ76_21345 [Thermoanaerobaculia bacterium]|nr:hypothetical protein [Thermoanaerobaculia bacterium]